MTNRDRFLSVLNFKRPPDRLPVVEWAVWWDQTLERWHREGLDPALAGDALYRHFKLDVHRQYWFSCLDERCPKPASHGAALIQDQNDYERLLPLLYPEQAINSFLQDMRTAKPLHDAGELVLWFSMDGGFWFPRTLFGIENHFFSFYDYPELYHRILEDLAEFQIRQMKKIFAICTPEFMTFAEDMSYNKGPMLSKDCFFEFLAPYYRRVIPVIKQHGTKVFVDTDGDVTMMLPWLLEVGVEGVLPLEKMAGVDILAIREQYPSLLLLGAFDKMVMKNGEAAMRKEFERILPVMKQGGYLPGVDHQTPPDVSLEQFHCFIRLMKEYAAKAVSEG